MGCGSDLIVVFIYLFCLVMWVWICDFDGC